MNTLNNIIGFICSLCWLVAIYALVTVTPKEAGVLFFALVNACAYSFVFLVTAPKAKKSV